MKDVSSYAKIDPALFADGLFVPKANKHKAINVKHEWDGGEISFRGVQLGAAHQSALLAVCARLGRSGKLIVKGSEKDLHGAQLDLLKVTDEARDQDTATVEVSAYSLLMDAGMTDSGASYKRLADYLKDMQTFVMYRRQGKRGGASNLLCFDHEGDKFKVTVNWRIAKAILGDAQYVRISLSERNHLKDPTAKILHAWLSAQLRLGGSLGRYGVYIDTLMRHVWGDLKVSASVITNRRQKLIAALKDINGVNGWVCMQEGRKWHITRPKSLGNDELGSPGELHDEGWDRILVSD